MSAIFREFEFVVVYLDNIIVKSNNVEQHLHHCKQVLRKINEVQLKVNPKKCHFARTSIKILGHVINQEGISVDQTRIEALSHFPVPQSVKALESFLGVVNYLRPFIPNAAELLAPLFALKSNEAFQKAGAETVEHHVNEVKKALLTLPLLRFPVENKQMFIATDASAVGIGAVLYQPDFPNQGPTLTNLISLASRSLLPYEAAYSTFKKELLGIVFALQKFHYYVFASAKPVVVCTDHQALTTVMSAKKVHPTIAGWISFISHHDLVIRHIPGKKTSFQMH